MNSSLSLLAQSPLYLVGLSMSEHWAEDIERQWIVQLVFCIISTLGCSFIVSIQTLVYHYLNIHNIHSILTIQILSIILLKIKKVHYQYVACLGIITTKPSSTLSISLFSSGLTAHTYSQWFGGLYLG